MNLDLGHFEPILGVRVLDFDHFGLISRGLGLDSDPVEAYPGGYLNGLTGFGPGSCGPAFGPVSEVELLGLDSDPF